MTPKKTKKLGRGLAALLGDQAEDYQALDKVRSTKQVAIEYLKPGRYQPRRLMDDGPIAELAASIKDKGIIQPIVVRRHPDDATHFEIIAGERRWRAAQVAQLHEVPILVREFTDQEALEVALVENLQRQDLSPLEEAEAYQRLMDEFGHTQEELSQGIGKSRSHIANTIRLLGLPDEVKAMLDDGRLTAGHARAILVTDDPVELARKVVARNLNVRETERLAKSGPAKPTTSKGPSKDADTLALERDLTNLIGVRVTISPKGQGGTLALSYKSLDQLDEILGRLHGKPA